MPDYRAPTTDQQFLLHDWLDIASHYQSIGKGDFDKELVNEVLQQGAKFAEEVVAPLNREGDETGCKLENGNVTTPNGFASAYKEYVENGWNSMLGNEEFGGQELPYSMAVPFHEMLMSANLSWRLLSMLTESAILAVDKHASDELKATYLPNLISGEWTGTMCLTEPQAGTDLALLNTKAEPAEDGSYQISGSKIFISGGDQDWTDNIVHLVLARLPDAPPGVKGISLFIVPKFLPNEAGEFNQPNTLGVGSLEHKMGIKGCPTCVMNFDSAKGWLVGAPHTGLACMFTMMNDARFQVGLQGLGLAEASYQGAVTYAIERLQSRAPQGTQQPDQKADSIIHQPDVRRMLLTQKALVEGCRALSLVYAKQMDVERFGDTDSKHQASEITAYLTPIVKAFFTDVSMEVTNIGVQVFGGHGYIREWGMEQLVRDSRITQLYEGTNGIQALDLISRKLARDGGKKQAVTHAYFRDMAQAIEDADKKTHALALLDEWNEVSQTLMQQSPDFLASGAYDYMLYSSYALIGVIWLSMADTVAQSDNPVFKSSKVKTADFYIKRILPRKDLHKSAIQFGSDDLLAPTEEEFTL
ncbi:acyl-CoA dehydrogenase family protein [Alteromonas sp. a30]|uniref:acyl-CoA dehydrogenase family protein n=1 Tax=Alteromonas sp. a30 TaxID=2730917 RepID=UPI00227DCF67|nr:acyl-CoA dehydrogenase family protein [Alteromonas sp. a30]MCY7296073.1 acyl-CoA dehydrogenase [Alteromonas sp. a30]